MDGKYPKYPFFVQTVQNPLIKKEKLMAKIEDGRTKDSDSERAFGVLQGKLHMKARPSGLWYKEDIYTVI